MKSSRGRPDYKREWYHARLEKNREASRLRTRKWRLEHRAELRAKDRAYKRRYYRTHREKVIASKKADYEAHRETRLAQKRDYRLKNRDHINAVARARYRKKRKEIRAKAQAYLLAKPNLPELRARACAREKARRAKDPEGYRHHRRELARKLPEKKLKARIAYRKGYYLAHREEINAKRREYRRRLRDLLRSMRSDQERRANRRHGPSKSPPENTAWFKVGREVERLISQGLSLVPARKAVQSQGRYELGTISRYHKRFRKHHLIRPGRFS